MSLEDTSLRVFHDFYLLLQFDLFTWVTWPFKIHRAKVEVFLMLLRYQNHGINTRNMLDIDRPVDL
jgi:hypothetical protein